MQTEELNELIKKLAGAKRKTADDFRRASIVDLQRERASALEMLTDLNSASGLKDQDGYRSAVRFVEDELAAITSHLRDREEGVNRDGAAARRQDTAG